MLSLHGLSLTLWFIMARKGTEISRPSNEKYEFIILKLFLFLNIISLKSNIIIPAMLHRHYPVPIVVLRKICKILHYNCNRLLIRRKTLTSEKDFQVLGRGRSQWEPYLGNMVDVSTIHSVDPLIFPFPNTLWSGVFSIPKHRCHELS